MSNQKSLRDSNDVSALNSHEKPLSSGEIIEEEKEMRVDPDNVEPDNVDQMFESRQS